MPSGPFSPMPYTMVSETLNAKCGKKFIKHDLETYTPTHIGKNIMNVKKMVKDSEEKHNIMIMSSGTTALENLRGIFVRNFSKQSLTLPVILRHILRCVYMC